MISSLAAIHIDEVRTFPTAFKIFLLQLSAEHASRMQQVCLDKSRVSEDESYVNECYALRRVNVSQPICSIQTPASMNA